VCKSHVFIIIHDESKNKIKFVSCGPILKLIINNLPANSEFLK